MEYTIRQIKTVEYEAVRQLDRDAFGKNERGSDADLHEIFADNIRRSPYFIPELDLIAVMESGFILGHGIFSRLPMGDDGSHVIWLNSLAIKHGINDNHQSKTYEYQRKGIGTAIVKYGLETAKILGFTACMTCGNPAVYRIKMGFRNYRDFNITRDESVTDPDAAIHAIELKPNGFEKTNKHLTYSYYDFLS